MPTTHAKLIPLAHSLLSAGPTAAVDEGYALLDLNALITGGREGCLAFIVTGDSMKDEIRPGYLVFIDPLREPRNGDAVAVSINNETCIKIFERSGPHLYLVPRNKEYERREVKPSDDFHVLGVVHCHMAVY